VGGLSTEKSAVRGADPQKRRADEARAIRSAVEHRARPNVVTVIATQ
jgi:hypothetical protein